MLEFPEKSSWLRKISRWGWLFWIRAGGGILALIFVSPRDVIVCMPPFFWKHNTLRGSRKLIFLSLAVPPHQHITPWMWVNTGIIRYFEKWGDFEEKVERQGKGDQNVWNEPIGAPLSPWVHNMACWAEIPFSNLNIFKNHPYFRLFPQRESFQQNKVK